MLFKTGFNYNMFKRYKGYRDNSVLQIIVILEVVNFT